MRVLVSRGECPPGMWAAGQRVRLNEAEVHHLRVRRASGQEQVEVLDGAGLRGSGHLVQQGRDWLVDLHSVAHEPAPADLVLAVGAGDRERFSWLVEKAAELGVTGIVPLETAHTAGVSSRLKESHLSRLRQSLLEVLKQSGAAWAPVLKQPETLDRFLQRGIDGSGWLADRSGAAPPAELDASPVTVVIGPEGGFTEAEREALVQAGYVPVALGTHTLRFETAAVLAAGAAAQARLRRPGG
jgi:16S rRNA (uracil1498-N3)-methyltransferase